jgi:hypothetical protein
MSALAASPQSISCLVAATQKAIPGTSFSDEPEVPTVSGISVKNMGLIFIARQGRTPLATCERATTHAYLAKPPGAKSGFSSAE